MKILEKLKRMKKNKKEQEYIGLRLKVEETKSKIRIFKAFKRNQQEWRINPYIELFDIDALYDLIKADLVEKVEEK